MYRKIEEKLAQQNGQVGQQSRATVKCGYYRMVAGQVESKNGNARFT
jgi:hypothetical protein